MNFIDEILKEAFKPQINMLKGRIGEWEISFILQYLNGYGKCINNVYIPYRGYMAEMDVVFIHEKGIFVIESKNYAGWIFGSIEQQKWTQCLPNREKNYFYNPIKQNRTHINALSQFIKINKNQMKSFIVFSERCQLKKVPPPTNEYTVVRVDELFQIMKKEIEKRKTIFTREEVNNLASLITKSK